MFLSTFCFDPSMSVFESNGLQDAGMLRKYTLITNDQYLPQYFKNIPVFLEHISNIVLIQCTFCLFGMHDNCKLRIFPSSLVNSNIFCFKTSFRVRMVIPDFDSLNAKVAHYCFQIFMHQGSNFNSLGQHCRILLSIFGVFAHCKHYVLWPLIGVCGILLSYILRSRNNI